MRLAEDPEWSSASKKGTETKVQFGIPTSRVSGIGRAPMVLKKNLTQICEISIKRTAKKASKGKTRALVDSPTLACHCQLAKCYR